MGVVHLAHDDQLDRPVAIKLLRPGRDGDPRRLLREARSMARLSHPNIAAVHDVGTHAGAVYVAMEYVEGSTLREWMPRSHPWDERVRVLLQAARGLAAAHASGIVHRDFKPDNVIVGADGRVRVLDFGLAKLAPSTGGPSLESTSTAEGHLVGTPRYMAPEQLRTKPASPASDQFSFCVTAYEVAYGQRPFAGEVFAEVAASVLGGLPDEPPSTVSDVPAMLWPLLRRGMAREEDARHPDMQAIIEGLEAAGRPEPAPPVSRAELRDAREDARQQLTTAYTEDLIDADELDDRLERLENATSTALVQQLCADLAPAPEPAPPGALAVRESAPPAVITPVPEAQIVAVFSETQRRGRWVPARENKVYAAFGSAELDLREADLPPGVTEIKVKAALGSVEIYVLPGTRVQMECSAILGSAELDEPSVPPASDGPVVRITGLVVLGSVEVHERLVGEGAWSGWRRRRAARKALRAERKRKRKALPPG